MNTTNEKLLKVLKTSVCALAFMSVIGTAAVSFAANDNKNAAQATNQVEKSAQAQAAEKRKEIVSEAMSALSDTRLALKALEEKDSKKALSILQGVTGKLEIILARDSSLTLVPANVDAVSYSIIATVDDVKKIRKQAEGLLNDGRVQEARRLMQTLASETEINTTNIPLATYPAAIKHSAKLIDQGKMEEARNVLQAALNTVVVTQKVIPLPVVAAEAMLKEAESLAEKKERKEEENKRLSELLTAAQDSIKLAQELGYGRKDDFSHFYEEISILRDKTAEGKSGLGFFDVIKGYMTSMIKDSQPGEAKKEKSEKAAE